MNHSKKTKSKKIYIITFIICLVMATILFFTYTKLSNKEQNNDVSQNISPSSNTTLNEQPKDNIDINDPASQFIIVNKNRPILLSYVPSDLVSPNVTLNNQKSNSENSIRNIVAPNLESLFVDAKKNNLDLMLASGYRSAELQGFYYNNLVQSLGQAEADTVSAKPGTSEHQTGLALDIASTNRECYLEACFADTKDGIWLKDNAYKYGFILRYPLYKDKITGYQYEPWHFRYVGKDLAQKIYSQNTTLEEYFNL